MLSNQGLVDHAKMALSEQWGYVWGTFGQILTEQLFQQKLAQYPNGVGDYTDFIRSHWLNKRTADCIGLIKSYMWWATNGPNYAPATDVSADGMFAKATEKGAINTLPETPGICLWKPGHIGVYTGNGQVIEARGTMYGVISSSLTNNNPGWTSWLKCPFINYDGQKEGLSIGSNGDAVKDLQTRLNKIGYSLVVDGDFGVKTEAAVKNFQANNNLPSDGIVDTPTNAAINAMINKLDPTNSADKLDCKQILKKVSSDPDDWDNAINVAVNAAEAEGDLGALEIFKFLPELIVKVYYSK